MVEDQRSDQDREEDLLRARASAGRLAEAGRSGNRELLDDLKGRRDESGIRQKFDVVPDGDDPPFFLVVRDELLTTGAAFEDDSFRELADELGLDRAPAEEDVAQVPARLPESYLEGRVVRLRLKEGREGEDLEAIRARLEESGYQVSRLHLMPLGAVMKGETTPEYTSQPWPVWTPPDGSGPIPVAVIDTGIAHQHRDDGWLTDLFPPHGSGEEDPLDVLPSGPDGLLDAGAGHGSFVAGVIQQVAPEVPVVVYRVLDTDGLADEVQVACAILRAVDENLAEGGRLVLNLSLGTPTVDDVPPLSLVEALALVEQRAAERHGEVLVVAAAGNEGTDRRFWPAAFDQVVAVAGLDPDLEPAEFSSYGSWVDCSTVAVGVRSPYVAGEESTRFDPQPETWEEPGWAQWNGTSFAAPQVAGELAEFAGDQGITLREALEELFRGSATVPGYGRVRRIL